MPVRLSSRHLSSPGSGARTSRVKESYRQHRSLGERAQLRRGNVEPSKVKVGPIKSAKKRDALAEHPDTARERIQPAAEALRHSRRKSNGKKPGILAPAEMRSTNTEATQPRNPDLNLDHSELLHLAHDSIIVRDINSVILFWNRGAERTYGWTATEACGNVTHTFLRTEFPEPFDQIDEKLFKSGLWEGELIHRTREGKRITVASRQVVQRDKQGRAIGILEINNNITLRKEAEQSLRNLSARLMQLQDEERRRIARELHDSTGQSLAALVIHLSAVMARVGEADPTAAGLLREAIQLSQTASDEIRTLSYLLHPPTLDHAGLRSALEWYVDGFTQRSKVKVDLKVSLGPNRLTEIEERTLFRIVQESLTNIFRHSGSDTASVSISLNSGIVRLEVADNGKGIPNDILVLLNSSGGQLGVGIRGMRERVRQLGGWLQIRARRDGTTIIACFPVREAAGDDGRSRAVGSC